MRAPRLPARPVVCLASLPSVLRAAVLTQALPSPPQGRLSAGAPAPQAPWGQRRSVCALSMGSIVSAYASCSL